MRSRVLVCLFGVLPACARPAACPETRSVPARVAEPGPRVAETSPNPCWARGRPRPASPPSATRPFCNALDAREVDAVEARIRRELVVSEQPSKLVVDFGCDSAGAPAELVLESGSGHGGSLRIVRIQLQRDGRALVRTIDSQHLYDPAIVLSRGETTAAKLETLVAKARVALLARPHVIRLSIDGSLGGISSSFSSNNFHVLLRIEDKAHDVTERHFTGYESSDEQEAILPMRYATGPLEKVVETTPLVADQVTDEDRAFVTARFLATMANAPAWWIKERYVALVGALGTIDAVPALVPLVSPHGDPSVERTRVAAIEAIAQLTGWDARADRADVDEAARRIVAACTP